MTGPHAAGGPPPAGGARVGRRSRGPQGVFTTDTGAARPELEQLADDGDRHRGRGRRGPATLRSLALARRARHRPALRRRPRRAGQGALALAAPIHRSHRGRAARRGRCRRAGRSRRSVDGGRIIGTITIVDDVSERVATRARAPRPDRDGGTGARHGRSGVAREGRVPGDALARDPDAAERRARMDAHPRSPRRPTWRQFERRWR